MDNSESQMVVVRSRVDPANAVCFRVWGNKVGWAHYEYVKEHIQEVWASDITLDGEEAMVMPGTVESPFYVITK